jgi:hypothetical protein
MRTEAILEGFGVTEANWRDAAANHPEAEDRRNVTRRVYAGRKQFQWSYGVSAATCSPSCAIPCKTPDSSARA